MGMPLTGFVAWGGGGEIVELFIYSGFDLFVSCFSAQLCKISIQSPYDARGRTKVSPWSFGLSTEHKGREVCLSLVFSSLRSVVY